MNSQKTLFHKLYRYRSILPLIVILFYAINPLIGQNVEKSQTVSSNKDLEKFKGYYQFEQDKNLYLQILLKEHRLILKQLWDNEEISFDQKSDLEFYNNQVDFSLKFTKAENGAVTEVLAFGRDTWKKIKDYKPKVQKEVQLSAEQLKAFVGVYKINEQQELQFTTNGNHLTVKELWSGKEYIIVPESELEFFGKNAYYPVKFSKNKNGVVTQALIFNRDVWEKVL